MWYSGLRTDALLKGEHVPGQDCVTLADATWQVLEKTNGAVLHNPQMFCNYMRDYLDPDSVELRVLMLDCNASLLEPYARLLEGDLDTDEASARAEYYLVYTCVVAEEAAQRVTKGLAEGVTKYLAHTAAAKREPQPSEVSAAALPLERQTGAQHSGGDVRKPSPTAIRKTPVLVGEARWHGTVNGIEYVIDQRCFSQWGLTGALHLRNTSSEAVSVTVVSESQNGGHPNDTCRNLPSGGLGLIVFPNSVTGIDSISVKTSRGVSSDVRFAWSAHRIVGQGEDSVELRIANVSGERARIARIVVADDANSDIVCHKLGKQGLEQGADISLSFSIAKGHAFGVYVNGVRLSEGVTEITSKRKESVTAAPTQRDSPTRRADKSTVSLKATLVQLAVVAALVIVFGVSVHGGGKDVASATDASARDASDTPSQSVAEYAPPSDFPNPYEGTYGTWQDGVYTSEKLGIRIEPTDDVLPEYGVVANTEEGESQSIDCAYWVDGGDDWAHLYVGPWEFATHGNEGIEGSSIVVGEDAVESHYEPVEFCGREWWKAEAYSEQSGYGVTAYLTEMGDGYAQLNVTVVGDPSAAEKLLAAVGPLSEG